MAQDSASFVALVQATAGATGGVFASFVLMPLEVAKTRIQVSQTGDCSTIGVVREIFREDGVGGLFCGVVAKCTETGSKNFVYFYIYDALNAMAKLRGFAMTTPLKLLLGYSAGVVNTILTMPLEVLATRLQVENKGAVALTAEILQKEGVAGLFSGFWFNVALCVNPAIQNTCFDQMKARLIKSGAGLTPLQAFTLGALAKAVATVLTFPLVRLKTMLQAGKPPVAAVEDAKPASGKAQAGASLPRSQSMTEMLGAMQFRSDRVRAAQNLLHRIGQLYRGLASSLTKSVLQAALLYMTKDQVEEVVVRLFKLTAKLLMRRSGRVKLGAFSGRPLAS